MKKVKIICFFALTGLSSLAQASSQSVDHLRQAYLSESNKVTPYEQGTLSSVVPPSSPAFYDEESDNQSSLFGRESSRKMSSTDSSILVRKDEEEEDLFQYLNNSNFRQNEILSPELYTQILRDEDPRSEPDLLSRSTEPCQSNAGDILDSGNIDDLSRPIQNVEQQHQFCGFESEYLLGSFNSSVNFCECVRDKTNQSAESEEGLYRQVSDPEDFRQAMDLYRQSLVDKVMPDLLEEVGHITSASNDFLSTDELSHMLYEVYTDEQVEDDDARTLLEKTRQGMHSCSGLGMANLMKDLYAPSESGEGICDQKSAEFLLEGFVKAMECESGECDDYQALSGSDMYEEQSPQDILSDFMTHKYSVNLIKGSAIFDENFSTLSDFEKYSKVVTTADAMTEFDPSGRPFVNPGMVERQRRLPSEEQLRFLHSLSQNPKNSADLASELSVEQLDLLDDVMSKLARNALYRDQTYFSRSYSDLTNEEKVGSLRGFVRKIEADKEKRIRDLPFSEEYFEKSSGPVEAMQKMITNNYLYLGDEVTKSCARTRRKLKKLCSSISGDGLALFSHPDFRNHTDEMLLDADLQKEVSEIANDGKDGRSPLADQLYCHANYSSMSADCDEDADMKNNTASSSYHHCFYDGDWLFSHEFSEIGKGATGNTRLANQSFLQEAQEAGGQTSAGQNDFLSMVNSERDVPVYKPADRELRDVANFNQNSGLSELEVDATQREVPELEPVETAETFEPQNITQQESTSHSLSENDYSNRVSEKAFSQNFNSVNGNQVHPQAVVEDISEPEAESVPPRYPNIPTAAQTLRNTQLKEELDTAQLRQAKLEAQLEELLEESEKGEDEEHQEKLEEKSAELENLQGEIRKLESDIKQEKQVSSRGQNTQESTSRNTPTRSRATSGPKRSQTSSGDNDQIVASTPSRSASSPADPSSAESSDAQTEDSKAEPQRSAANVASNSGFGLRSVGSQQLLPSSVDLTSVAKQLRDENYILLDIGEPGKAEKVIFESGPDGEVLFNESGGPLIASREVIELEEGEQASLEQAEEVDDSSAELGEVDDTPSYRWNEVERLLDLKTD